MKTVRTPLDKEFDILLAEMNRKLTAIQSRALTLKEIDVGMDANNIAEVVERVREWRASR